MKLRLDLLERLTAADILKEAVGNPHRCKAEPAFSKTGTDCLSSTSTGDSAEEVAHLKALTRKLVRGLKKNGKNGARPD
jgi:hypothetical protein